MPLSTEPCASARLNPKRHPRAAQHPRGCSLLWLTAAAPSPSEDAALAPSPGSRGARGWPLLFPAPRRLLMRSPCGARAAAPRGLAPDAVWKLFGLAVEGTQPGPLAWLSVGGTRGFNPFLALPARVGPRGCGHPGTARGALAPRFALSSWRLRCGCVSSREKLVKEIFTKDLAVVGGTALTSYLGSCRRAWTASSRSW